MLQTEETPRNHPTGDVIYLQGRSVGNHIGRGTVYRNLEKFCEPGQ